MNLDMVTDYLSFVEARHRAWEARQAGAPQPWTSDPIVNQHKFTNVFRVLDFGSQYVGRELLEPATTARERLMRAFLYRHTGRPEPWQWFELLQGSLPTLEKLLSGELGQVWREYRGGTRHVTRGKNKGGGGNTNSIAFDRSIFTGAYLVFPQSQTPGTDKLDSILELTARLFDSASPEDIVPEWEAASSQRERFELLRRTKGVGDFMAMQILTDWGYLTDDREDEFVICGPGAQRGARHLAPEWKPERTAEWARRELGELGIYLALPDGRRRAPSLMDAQNTLCEFSKYVRFAAKPRSGQLYRPAHPGTQPPPWLPPGW